MEDAGVVVYFKNSPSAQAVGGDARLMVPDEDSAGNGLGQLDPAPSGSTLEPTTNTNLMSVCKNLIRHISGRGMLHCSSAQEEMLRVGIIKEITRSPLLTEEDFQLLTFTLPSACNDNPSSQDEDTRPCEPPSVAVPRLQPLLPHVAVVVVATVLAVFGCRYAAGAVAVTTGTFFALRTYSHRRLRTSAGLVSAYLQKSEAMLSLLTSTIRTIQEVEVIACGYTRPSRMVPVTKVEGQGGGYQCMPLRRRVFASCTKGLMALRRATQDLCQHHTLAEEVVGGGLAMTPLHQLHSHMTQQWAEVEEGEEGKPPHLSLESIKDGCCLLAAQNSEYLCRMALCLSQRYNTSPDVSLLYLPGLGPQVTSLCSCFDSIHSELSWSNEFHKNQYFGDPPSRHKPSKRSNKGLPPELSDMAEDVHCLDLKAQLVLMRIRTLESHLEQLSTDQQGPDVDLNELQDQVLSLKEGLEGAQEHVRSCLLSLSKLSDPKTPLVDTPTQAHIEVTPDLVQHAGGEETTCSNDDTSDDEMVYEAYIPPGGVMGEGAIGEEEEGRTSPKVSSEVPMDMVRELQSVLSVRASQRQQRREERRKRRGVAAPLQAAHPPAVPPPCTPSVEGVAEGVGKEGDGEGVTAEPTSSTTSSSTSSTTSSTTSTTTSSSSVLMPTMETLANMIRLASAAAAAGAAKVTEEVVFEDDT